jgi:putative hemolysin
VITAEFKSAIPGFLRPILGLDRIEQTYAELRAATPARPFTERLLDHLQVTWRVADRDLAQIPRKGPVVLVVNHPFGLLEGAVLATVLPRIRPDTRFLANKLLGSVPELRDLLVTVDKLGGGDASRGNRAGLRRSIEHLENGGLLVVFPAGEVSHFQWRERAVRDPEWSPTVARMIEIAVRRGAPVEIVPAYVSGSNSFWFHAAGMLHPSLRTLLLARELFNKRSSTVNVRIGSPIASEKLLAISTPEEQIEYLRWRTYLLENRSEFKADTARPLSMRRARATEPIAAAVSVGALAADVAALSAPALLAEAGALVAYVARAHEIPNVLREIGRLREITFRAAGEGTARSSDLDRFDQHYWHLFLWNREQREIAGSYRLAGAELGADALYTATLFHYGQAFLDRMGPALELGRSFVRPEYQKAFAPLLLLWKGIGRFIARNPHYKTLFGAVSISNQYQSVSRELMVNFLERNASLKDWAGLIAASNPFRRAKASRCAFDLDDLSQVVSDLEPTRAGVPVLLRQYLKLGGKLLGFNVDPGFSDALDGLILVDLTRTEPRLLERYLGKAEAGTFLAANG